MGFTQSESNSLYDKALETKSIEDAELALKYAIDNLGEAEIADAYFLHGYNCKYNGMYYNALNSYNSALVIYRELENEAQQAAIIENIGIIYTKARFYEDALKYYQDALEIKMRQPDSTAIARSFYNIGRVYRFAENYTEAIKSFKKSIIIYRSQNNHVKVSQTNNEIGLAYKLSEQYDSAVNYYSKLTQGYEPGSKQCVERQTLMINNLASMQISQEKYDEAFDLLQDGLSKKYSDNITAYTRSLLYENVARIYDSLNVQDSVIIAYERSIREAGDVIDPDLYEIYKALAANYQLMNDHENAYKYYNKIMAIADEMSTLQLELEQLNVQYQVSSSLYKQQRDLQAAAAYQSKIIWLISTGSGTVILSLLLFTAYSRAMRRKEVQEEQRKRDQKEVDELLKELRD